MMLCMIGRKIQPSRMMPSSGANGTPVGYSPVNKCSGYVSTRAARKAARDMRMKAAERRGMISQYLEPEDREILQRAIFFTGKPADEMRAEYRKRFIKAMDSEPNKVKKVNAGRRAANLWLLEKTGMKR